MKIKFKKFIDSIYASVDKKEESPSRHIFNFRRLWFILFFSTVLVAIIPLLFFAIVDLNITQRAIESDLALRTSRLTSNTKSLVKLFVNERKLALDFIVREHTFTELSNHDKLTKLLNNLRQTYGGFTDLGFIDSAGVQRAYVGPYKLKGKHYSNHFWFKKTLQHGKYVSDIFLGFRNVPHLAFTVKKDFDDGNYFMLRATIEDRFINMLSNVKVVETGDAFMITKEGVLQTPSRFFGNVLGKIPIEVPTYSEETKAIETTLPNGEDLIISYAFVEDTPFILMAAMRRSQLNQPWSSMRINLYEVLVISVTVIILFVLGMTNYVVRRLKETDRRRIRNFKMAEQSTKMASIGRLAAGIAHEINNPLAIINEKAGYIKDKFTLLKEYNTDKKLLKTADSIVESVERCSKITKRLLYFASHHETNVVSFDMKEVIFYTLDFLEKEAQHKSIDVSVKSSDNLPKIKTDKGKVQQILLNLFNNAFDAMEGGGELAITLEKLNDKKIKLKIGDTGCGISQENLEKVFEPFFTTKSHTRGTGLGLSITYALVKEISGDISVKSELGKGTTFTILLPLEIENLSGKDHANFIS